MVVFNMKGHIECIIKSFPIQQNGNVLSEGFVYSGNLSARFIIAFNKPLSPTSSCGYDMSKRPFRCVNLWCEPPVAEKFTRGRMDSNSID